MLTPLDWTIIGMYLLMMVSVGIACRGRQVDSGDYFIAKGGLSGMFGSVLVGLSIAATYFSGITFLAYPSIIYQHGLLVVMGIPTLLVVWVVLRFVFLPRYLGGGWRHPYEILEKTYGRGVRATAAAMFVLLRVGWMATLIFAPTTAIMAAAGLGEDAFWPVILTIGLSSTLYTALGGIRGVIVTDAIQFILIIAGISMVLIYIFANLPVPAGEAISMLSEKGRLRWWNPSLSLTQPLTLWAVLIGYSVANTGSYIGDQMSLQRYLTSSSLREASRSFLINVIGVVLVLLLLTGVGVALAAWYALRPTGELPDSADRIFPFFIARELPPGVSGLLLAALLAATMSSITSGINALAASIMMDFRVSNSSNKSRRELRTARIVSLLIGVVSTLSAGLVAHLGGLFDITQKLLGVFIGPLAVCLLLAALGLRMKGAMMVAALMVGCAIGWAAALSANAARAWAWVPAVDSMWVSPIACLGAAMVAALGAALFRRNGRDRVSAIQETDERAPLLRPHAASAEARSRE